MQPIALKSECSFMGHSNRRNRLDLNNPHTSVCGILLFREGVSYRPDLNNPHTSVCGILGFLLGKAVGQPRESPDAHSHGEVLAFNVGILKINEAAYSPPVAWWRLECPKDQRPKTKLPEPSFCHNCSPASTHINQYSVAKRSRPARFLGQTKP